MAGLGNGWEVWKFLGWILSSHSCLGGARMKKKKGLYPINYCQTSAQMSTLALTVCSASLLPRGGQKVHDSTKYHPFSTLHFQPSLLPGTKEGENKRDKMDSSED